jgi:hypothetical protein
MAEVKPEPVPRREIGTQLSTDLQWYEEHANRNRLVYQVLVGAGFAFGVAVTVAGVLRLPPELTALLGIGVTSATTLLGLSQAQRNSIRFRMTHQALEAEQLEFTEGSGPYAGLDPTKARARLASRRNVIVSAEYGEWKAIAARQATASEPASPGPDS